MDMDMDIGYGDRSCDASIGWTVIMMGASLFSTIRQTDYSMKLCIGLAVGFGRTVKSFSCLYSVRRRFFLRESGIDHNSN